VILICQYNDRIVSAVCTVSSQWLDIFIQFSVSHLYIGSGAA